MFVNYLIAKLVQFSGLGFFDMLLGALFGCVRGLLVVMIIVMFLSLPWVNMQNIVDQSCISHWLNPMVSWAMQHMPSSDVVSDSVQHFIPQEG